MNLSWCIYYGLRLGLSRVETLVMRYGEFMDLIACDQIYNGIAEPKEQHKTYTFDEAMALR